MQVLVTGASGHLGYNLCRALGSRPGYEVRGSVRSLADAARTAPLRALGGVELVELDVRDPAGFEAALRGVEVLFHVAASYVVVTRGEAQVRELLRDSVQGAETALAAAARAGVRRVVLTSSVVTLPLRRPGEPPATEADWASDLRVPYFRAKTEGERAAWRLAERLKLDLVTVLPGGIGGPGFHRRTPTLDLLEGIMLGMLRMGAPRLNFTYVDARDVADAHVLAAEKGASGRYIVSNELSPTFMEFARTMHEIDPAVPAAPLELPAFVNPLLPLIDALNSALLGSPRTATPEAIASLSGLAYRVSSARARAELGWSPRFTLRESLADTMVAIRALRRAEGRRRMV